MGFIKKTFDMKKLARSLRARPDEPGNVRHYYGAPMLGELIPAMREIYIQILRHEEIFIADLDFASFEESDIDDLESVLACSPLHELFKLSDVFREFEPSGACKRVFI